MYSSTLQARDGCRSIGSRARVGKQRQPLLGGRQRAGQELAFSQVATRERKRARAAAPSVLRQQCAPAARYLSAEAYAVGRLGTLAGEQVELGQLFPFLWCSRSAPRRG